MEKIKPPTFTVNCNVSEKAYTEILKINVREKRSITKIVAGLIDKGLGIEKGIIIGSDS